ncbi:kinase-like domain, phloem protein 2-like protein, partial [Tanacetum coccineum]
MGLINGGFRKKVNAIEALERKNRKAEKGQIRPKLRALKAAEQNEKAEHQSSSMPSDSFQQTHDAVKSGVLSKGCCGIKEKVTRIPEPLNNQISTLSENILFEILSGTLAYDSVYLDENNKGLAPITRRRFSEGTLKELIDPTMMVEDNEQMFTLSRVQATQAFEETYCFGFDAHGMVHKAELDQFESKSSSSVEEKNTRKEANKRITVAIKRISCREDEQGEQGFFEELDTCISYKHPNIASLLGFCDEGREMIFVYEHACNGSLDDYFGSNDDKIVLTWAQCLHKCLEIARGLSHLHTKMGSKQSIIHGDIRSANIFFGKNFEAEIAYFGLSNLHPANQEANTKVYLDPVYETTGKLGRESDIYSFGVVLFEIICGKLAYDLIYNRSDQGLALMARQCYNDGTIKEMIDPKLLEETDEDGSTANKGPNQDSLDTFLKLVCQCLGETHIERPTIETVITELDKALSFQ